MFKEFKLKGDNCVVLSLVYIDRILHKKLHAKSAAVNFEAWSGHPRMYHV